MSSNDKIITLTFDLGQVCNDVLVKSNLISQTIRDVAMEDIKANVQEPDNPETRSIICRAVTEAFGLVKVACQRYLDKGRTADNNNLERLVASATYDPVTVEVQAEDSQGHKLWTIKVSEEDTDVWWDSENEKWKVADGTTEKVPDAGTEPVMKMTTTTINGEVATITYEVVTLVLRIPNFNIAVTDHLKSMIHKYVVDWVMYRFLQDQVADKAGEYKELADGEDHANIVSDLNARERYTMRKPSFM